MGEARLDLSGAGDNRMMKGLIVFLRERAKGARVSVPPGGMGSKMAGTSGHLVNTTRNKVGEASKSVSSETGTLRVGSWYRRAQLEPTGKKKLFPGSSKGLVGD